MKKEHHFWIEQFLENCRQTNRSVHTLKNYHADIKKFINWYEQNYKKLITKAQGKTIGHYKEYLQNGGPVKKDRPQNFVQNILGLFKRKLVAEQLKLEVHQLQAPLAVNSRRRHLSTIKNFFEFLKQTHEDHSKLFHINPVKSKIHGIKLRDIDFLPTKTLTLEDWVKLQDKIYRLKERMIINILYYGGLRISELCSLKFTSFDHASKTINFTRKGGYIHQLAIYNDQLIFQLLDAHRTGKEAGDFLFPGRKNQAISTKAMHTLISKMFLKAGCQDRLTPHSFRKACASNLYLTTKDLLFVRDYLNHRDAKVTQGYIDRVEFVKTAKQQPNQQLKLVDFPYKTGHSPQDMLIGH